MPLISPEWLACLARLYSWMCSAFLPLSFCLQLGRHGVIGLVHVGEHGVAAGRRQFERVEKSVLIRSRRIAEIDVKPELAVAEGADRLAVHFDVGDQQHLLVILLHSLGTAAQGLGRFFAAAEVAEIGRKPKLVVLRQRLRLGRPARGICPRPL